MRAREQESKTMVYLDNAATTLHKPPYVAQYMEKALQSMSNSGRGGYETSLSAARIIFETRERICRLFQADSPSCVAFAMNATMALNTAIKGLGLERGDEVVTTVMEHNSVLRPLYELEKTGVTIRFAGCDEKGRLNMKEMERLVSKKTKAVICTHASNLTGNVNDIGRISGIAKSAGAVFVADASQTAGVIPVQMGDMGLDVVCFTGHKGLCGPQGTGGLVVSPRIKIRPLMSGGTGVHSYDREQPQKMPEALEAGTQNGHGIAGLCGALTYMEEQKANSLFEKEDSMARLFYEKVSRLDGVQIYGSFEEDVRCPIVALNIKDYDSAKVSDELANTYEIAVRGGAHCAPLMHRALHTGSQGAVRFSFSFGNTFEEVEYTVWAIRKLLEE